MYHTRWDWLFETPPPSVSRTSFPRWSIPTDDPRLHHVTHLQELGYYEASRLKIYEDLIKKYTNQDLAAWRFIFAIRKTGNHDVAQQLEKMDLERKRCQVQTDLFCVRQVKLTNPTNPEQVRPTYKLLPTTEDLKKRQQLEASRAGKKRRQEDT